MSERIWAKIVEGFKAILLADCRPALEMSLDDQRQEEDFDLAVIVTIETHLLPKLGGEAVPSTAISTLAEALRDASRLHDLSLHHESASIALASPALTYGSRSDSLDRREPRFANSFDEQANAPSNDFFGSTSSDTEVPRERFAYWCLDLLFHMCDSHKASGGKSRRLPTSHCKVLTSVKST